MPVTADPDQRGDSSTVQQFNSSTITQFNGSTIQQFNDSDFYVQFKSSAETKFNNFLKCRNSSFFYIVLNFRNVGFSCSDFFCKLFLCHSHFNTSIMN